jgi:hypothetical protein
MVDRYYFSIIFFPDEMYEILSYLPEDLSFYCRKCFPVGCPEWESTLKRELRLGLENILQSLILSKSSQYILKQEKVRLIFKKIDLVICHNNVYHFIFVYA